MFSKIIPSFFTIKEGSTSHPGPLSSGAREKTALLGALNRYALRLADHQRSSPWLCGMGPPGMTNLLIPYESEGSTNIGCKPYSATELKGLVFIRIVTQRNNR